MSDTNGSPNVARLRLQSQLPQGFDVLDAGMLANDAGVSIHFSTVLVAFSAVVLPPVTHPH
jgi:hypothetical protein